MAPKPRRPNVAIAVIQEAGVFRIFDVWESEGA